MNYSEIKDMAGLDSARTKLYADIGGSNQDILSSIETVKQTSTPTTIVAEGVRRASATRPLDRIVLSLIRRLIRR